MAALFDIDTHQATRFVAAGDGQISAGSSAVSVEGAVSVDAAFAVITSHVDGLGARAALPVVRSYKARLSAIENRLVADLICNDGNTRAAERALNDGQTSQGAINRATKRAQATKANSTLTDKIDTGELSEEQLDNIATAAAQTGGAAATDQDFIDKITGRNPDQGRALANDYIAQHTHPDDIQTEHDRRRILRKVSKFFSKKHGMDIIALQGDAVASKAIWAAIEKRADELYRADGGRDLPTKHHPRTRDQRLFDAAYELICNITTTPTGIKHQPRTPSSDNDAGAINDGNHGQSSPTRTREPAASPRPTTPAKPAKPQIFVAVTLDHLTGRDPATLATQIGLGLIPDTVLADYLNHADLFGVLFDHNGQPLWLGRAARHASLFQRYALILRDKHCVLCGADHTRCDAHHIMPWNAPDKGETNLDELVLLCGPCHRRLHDNHHTIHQDHNHTWRTRPATPNEIPPPKPNHPQRE